MTTTLDSDTIWMIEQVASLTDTIETMSPSEWAEQTRYLPKSVTSKPGYYSFDVTPYLREIADCLDQRSDVREISLMKGAQIGATVGILENGFGYLLDVVRSSPGLFLTADNELAKIRVEQYLTPMIEQSGLSANLKVNEEGNNRREAKTSRKIEWSGGGYCLFFGAQNANKMRSFSIRYVFEDETDSYPDVVGKDGDPCKLTEARTEGYAATRKIVRCSTPLISGTSKIEKYFEEGDKRYYYVPCKHCGEKQVLRFSATDEETGAKYGIIYNLDEDGVLIEESVRYCCPHCGGLMKNSDKVWMMPRGEWVPTAKPKRPNSRSYHISGLYSPTKTWASCVQDWLQCWDIKNNRPKDIGQAQQFYNNVLGKTWTIVGDRLRLELVSPHRREGYRFGVVPNSLAVEYTGHKIQLLTAAVDVHSKHIDVAVFGWSRGSNAWLIDYYVWEGDCDDLDDVSWNNLRSLIEDKVYESDSDGRKYKVQLTLVDAGYNNDLVCQFCASYERSVFPSLGRDTPARNQRIQEFGVWETQLGTTGFRITVDLYKDRWLNSLRKGWVPGTVKQPAGMFNAPADVTDKQLKELTTETKRENRHKDTNQLLGYKWFRPNGVRNELWDLLVYNTAALEIIMWHQCTEELELEQVSVIDFWNLAEEEEWFWEEAS